MTMEHSWSDLPDDLLLLIYAKVAGHLRCVRFAAVCRSWRDAATASRHAAPLAIPWHISSVGGNRDRTTRMFCPAGGEVLCIQFPSKAVVNQYVGAHEGGWIAGLTRKHMKLVVINLFSGVEVPLFVKQTKFVSGPCAIQKIVFSEPPTSSGCIIAALTHSSRIALCRVGCPEGDWWMMVQEQSRYEDIAFCNGELYGLTTSKGLDRLDITNKKGAISVVVTRLLYVQRAPSAYSYNPFDIYMDDTTHINHLFDLGGKLAMARTWFYNSRPPLFKVFELTYDRQGKTLKWTEMMSLGENALFLGETCSKAVRVPDDGRGWVERNCIYGANAFYFDNRGQQSKTQDKGVSGIKVAGYYKPHAFHDGTWLIPPTV